jgi:hypothetical protein
MENLLIKLRDREEIAAERINDAVGRIKNCFFCEKGDRILIPFSGRYFSFSQDDLKKIAERLNEPNLFGVKFNYKIVYLVLDNKKLEKSYLEVMRAAQNG